MSVISKAANNLLVMVISGFRLVVGSWWDQKCAGKQPVSAHDEERANTLVSLREKIVPFPERSIEFNDSCDFP